MTCTIDNEENKPMNEILVTPLQASKIIGVCRNTILNLEARGLLTALRDGNNHRRYRVSQVLEVAMKRQPVSAQGDGHAEATA